MQVLGIIPSRYGSTRFPGKPLALIGSKPMVQWVYEKASSAIEEVFVATDDSRIEAAVQQFNGHCILTSPEHRSGTDRCAEALKKISQLTGKRYDVVVNIQGDEPFIHPEQITSLLGCFSDPSTDIATLAIAIEEREDIFDPNKPKVVLGENKNALYFSRSPIPYIQGKDREDWLKSGKFLRHIGIYAYRSEVLEKITKLIPSQAELSESLEQLRWLSNGFKIKVEETRYGPFGIDTPADLEKARQKMGL